MSDPSRTRTAAPATESLPPADGGTQAATPSYVPADPGPPAPPSPAPPDGRYEIGEEIARGGMGVVYAARDRALNRTVAVKVLLDGPGNREAAARRFVAEAQIAGQLQHTGVPPVYDLGTLPDSRPFLAMKLIKGRTLADLLRDRPDPSHDQPRLVQVFEKVAETVAYAHSRGVIHRDLKPLNVMVGAFGEVQVMDWGLAKILASREGERPEDEPAGSVIETGQGDADRTRAGSVMGTPAYMPPEQARGDVDQVDRRADVFALGAMLCEILTGKPPYTGSFREVLAKAQLGQLSYEAHARLDESRADEELIVLVKHCLSAALTSRPADAGAVAAAVAAYRAGVEERLRKTEVERAAAAARAEEQRKRRRVQSELAFLAVLTIGVVGSVAGGVSENVPVATLWKPEGISVSSTDFSISSAESWNWQGGGKGPPVPSQRNSRNFPTWLAADSGIKY